MNNTGEPSKGLMYGERGAYCQDCGVKLTAEPTAVPVPDSNDPPTCKRCDDEYSLRDGCEVSKYCDPCAQEMVAQLEADNLDQIAIHRQDTLRLSGLLSDAEKRIAQLEATVHEIDEALHDGDCAKAHFLIHELAAMTSPNTEIRASLAEPTK